MGRKKSAAVSSAKPEPVCENCGESAGVNKKLLSCGGCRSTWYCSKDCQRGSWPEHKGVCELKVLKRAAGNQSDRSSSEFIREPYTEDSVLHAAAEVLLPKIRILLATELTGYEGETLVLAPLWEIDRDRPAFDSLGGAELQSFKASIREAIKRFFKCERRGDACFGLEEVADVGDKAVIALYLGLDGVRAPAPEEPDSDFRSTTIDFQTPVPRGWTLDPSQLTTTYSPRTLARIQEAVETVRSKLGEF